MQKYLSLLLLLSTTAVVVDCFPSSAIVGLHQEAIYWPSTIQLLHSVNNHTRYVLQGAQENATTTTTMQSQECSRSSEKSSSLIDYAYLIHCQSGGMLWLGTSITILICLLFFLFLGTASADYLLPNLSTLARFMRMSEELAGVTVIALGNTINDFVGNLLTFNRAPQMAIGQIVGSGLVLNTLIIGTVTLIATARMKTPLIFPAPWAFMREFLVYLLGLLILLFCCITGSITLITAAVMLCIYLFIYVGAVSYSYYRLQHSLDKDRKDTTLRTLSMHPKIITYYYPPSQHPLRESFKMLPLLRSENVIKQYERQNARASTSLTTALLSLKAMRRLLNVKSWMRVDIKSNKRVRFLQDVVEMKPRSAVIDDSTVKQSSQIFESCPICSQSVTAIENEIPFWTVMAYHFVPVYSLWNVHGWMGRILSLLTWWPTIVLGFTVPVVMAAELVAVVDESSLKIKSRPMHHSWILMMQVFIAPFLVSFAVLSDSLDAWSASILNVPVLVFPFIISTVFSLLIGKFYIHSAYSPHRYPTFALLGVLTSLAWIYIILQEIISALQAIGFVFGMSDGVLGFSLFTFGGSVSDFASAVTMTMLGYPLAAIAAVTSAPLINLYMSLSVAVLVAGETVRLDVDKALLTALVSLIVIVSVHIGVMFVGTRGVLYRWYGMALISVYLCVFTAVIALEVLM